MSQNTSKSAVSREIKNDYFTCTLTQLRAKIDEHEPFKSNIRYVPNSNTCRFEKCDPGKPTNLKNTKLYMGTYTVTQDNIDTMHGIWARVAKIDTLTNVTYHLDNDGIIKGTELNAVKLVTPFSYIKAVETLRGRHKVRFLVLWYFLEHGYLESIMFPREGFDTFRKAVAVVAKARAQVTLSPAPPLSPSSPLQQVAAEGSDLKSTKELQRAVAMSPAKVTMKDWMNVTLSSSSNRKRSPTDEDKETIRSFKKSESSNPIEKSDSSQPTKESASSNPTEKSSPSEPTKNSDLPEPALKSDPGDVVAYHFTKFMQHLQGQSMGDLESLKRDNAALEAKVAELTEERDKWEEDANFVKQQLKNSEKQRHDVEAATATAKEQIATLKTEQARLWRKMETTKRQLKVESEARKVQLRKLQPIQQERNQLRVFKN
ncbi:hypothetical protein BDU57DRAFT_569546 [Ampelomyces quisqualis]|uniref:Uncharacterized protein n=1 Tax=Ampelomyces quisqualis TaxID=50730 RepID=A0A6A5QV71_AMPQU|nr:hypothetical protein BDU57DRAFT_569546 [Ampelomyces quisqualis]